jgi:hypothetical protein
VNFEDLHPRGWGGIPDDGHVQCPAPHVGE